MPKMKRKNRVDDMYSRADAPSRFQIKTTPITDFCINSCPHKNEECNGRCDEFRTFKLSLKEKKE